LIFFFEKWRRELITTTQLTFFACPLIILIGVVSGVGGGADTKVAPVPKYAYAVGV
jgi:hypothetical protein